jgi:hypothetical protein
MLFSTTQDRENFVLSIAERVADTTAATAEAGSTWLVTRDSVRIWHGARRTGCIRAAESKLKQKIEGR